MRTMPAYRYYARYAIQAHNYDDTTPHTYHAAADDFTAILLLISRQERTQCHCSRKYRYICIIMPSTLRASL